MLNTLSHVIYVEYFKLVLEFLVLYSLKTRKSRKMILPEQVCHLNKIIVVYSYFCLTLTNFYLKET